MVVRIVREVLDSLFQEMISMCWNNMLWEVGYGIGKLAGDGVYCLTLALLKLATRW